MVHVASLQSQNWEYTGNHGWVTLLLHRHPGESPQRRFAGRTASNTGLYLGRLRGRQLQPVPKDSALRFLATGETASEVAERRSDTVTRW